MKNKAQTTFLTVILLGAVLCIAMYMYYYNPTKEKTTTLESTNAALQARVDTLKQFYDEMPENKKKISEMTTAIQEWLNVFPADVMEEDTIYFALQSMNLEGLQKLYDENVIPADERFEIPVSAVNEENVIDFPSITIGAQQKIAAVDAALVQGAKIEGLTDGINFMRRDVTFMNITDYNGLKCLIQSINADPEKKTLTDLSYNTDESGRLSGSVAVSFYSMEGNGKEYEPKDLSEYEVGLENIFVRSAQ